jgi:predicted lipid-binding transport protein (Tim44 family)
VTPTDFEAFERTLKEVNAAWSRQDLPTLQRLSTPEMAGYFSRDLSDLAGRGWRNETRDVALEQGDLSEAWREGEREYATVAMRFSLVDVTRRVSDGAVVEGDPSAAPKRSNSGPSRGPRAVPGCSRPSSRPQQALT